MAVPEEFSLYLNGAVKYHANDFKGAAAEWEKILALPKKARHFKSTWAAFMIGKSYLSTREQQKAVLYFEQTRKLAQEGYVDSLNLSDESVGWQALAEYELKNYAASISHYLKHMDVNSLNRLCLKISQTTDDTIPNIVKDQTSRNVLLGWAVSRPYWNALAYGEDFNYKDFFGRLLKSLEALGKKDTVDYADRVAWLYYNRGNIENAKRWVGLSKLKTPLAQYVDFKITLREGKIEDAVSKLSHLIPMFTRSKDNGVFFNEDLGRMLNSEMAVLRLSRKEYLKAFELLLRGKYWEDIAYVAEKVLTTEELEGFLKQSKFHPDLLAKQIWFRWSSINLREREDNAFPADSLKVDGQTLLEALNYLLARRYVREGRWDQAIALMPRKGPMNEDIDLKMKLLELKRLMTAGTDEKYSRYARGKAYFDAALLTRQYGMQLMGTELDPDGFVDKGSFPYDGAMRGRFAILFDQAKADDEPGKEEWIEKNNILRERIKKDRGFFYGSEEEEIRALKSLPSPNKRFHYRYQAAELMWQSARLLPDNDDLKARALCLGGTYLKVIASQEADRFYKTLVKTCGKTALGQEADKLKWFPKIAEN